MESNNYDGSLRRADSQSSQRSGRSSNRFLQNIKNVFTGRQQVKSEEQAMPRRSLSQMSASYHVDEQMPSEEEIEREFREIMAARMDSSNPDGISIPTLPVSTKWDMIKNARIQKGIQNQPASPLHEPTEGRTAIDHLIARMRANDTYWLDKELIKTVRLSLAMETISWVKEFADKRGIGFVLRGIRSIFLSPRRDQYCLECEYELIRCFRAFTNNRFGLQYVMGEPDTLNIIGLCACSENRSSRHLVYQFFAVYVHLKPPQTHLQVINALINGQKSHKDNLLFDSLVLLIGRDFEEVCTAGTSTKGRIDEELVVYLTDTMLFINSIIEGTEDDGQRMTIRNQIFRGTFRHAFIQFMNQGVVKEYKGLHFQCELFIKDLQVDAEDDRVRLDAMQATLGNISLTSLVSELESEGLRMLLCSLALVEHRDQYLCLLNAFLGQAIMVSMGLSPECSLIAPPLDYAELLKAAQGRSQLEQEVSTLRSELMRQEIAAKSQRQQYEQRLEDAEIALQAAKQANEEKSTKQGKEFEARISELNEEIARLNVRDEQSSSKPKAPSVTSTPIPTVSMIENEEVQVQRIADSQEDLKMQAPRPPSDPPARKGMPPPPPPPAPAKGRPAQSSLSLPKASKKTRQLQWDRIPDGQIKNTLWEGLNQLEWKSVIDFGAIEAMFSTREEQVKETKAPTSTEITFVDTKRALNLAIVLSSAKLIDVDALRRALLTVDYRAITDTLIHQLQKYIPTSDEIFEAQKYQTMPLEKMRKAEAFIVHISSSIHGYEHLLEAYKCKFSFKEWLDQSLSVPRLSFDHRFHF